MIVYITKFCSYAVKSMERADGQTYYRVMQVVPLFGESEWVFKKSYLGTSKGLDLAISEANRLENLPE